MHIRWFHSVVILAMLLYGPIWVLMLRLRFFGDHFSHSKEYLDYVLYGLFGFVSHVIILIWCLIVCI